MLAFLKNACMTLHLSRCTPSLVFCVLKGPDRSNSSPWSPTVLHKFKISEFLKRNVPEGLIRGRWRRHKVSRLKPCGMWRYGMGE